jgi:hypothetical protein
MQPFNAARWTEAAEILGFRIHVIVADGGKTELEIIVPRGPRDLEREATLWSDLRPAGLPAKPNEMSLCQYLKRTGRAVRARESLGRASIRHGF